MGGGSSKEDVKTVQQKEMEKKLEKAAADEWANYNGKQPGNSEEPVIQQAITSKPKIDEDPEPDDQRPAAFAK